MEARELAIEGAWEFTPKQWPDARGVFLEWFKAEVFEKTTGRSLSLAQANQSVSAKGTLRGVHFADVPPSQAKYVYCPSGAVLDVVVDIRVGSPTFGQHDSVRLDDVQRRAVFVLEGLGHAFIALSDAATVTYLVTEPFSPTREHGINPMDPALALPWPADIDPLLSDKDLAAPSLADAQSSGLLPSYPECMAFYDLQRLGR